eukprot:scaffold90352_cov75-Phaeocystis_antarctica.AAC.1
MHAGGSSRSARATSRWPTGCATRCARAASTPRSTAPRSGPAGVMPRSATPPRRGWRPSAPTGTARSSSARRVARATGSRWAAGRCDRRRPGGPSSCALHARDCRVLCPLASDAEPS